MEQNTETAKVIFRREESRNLMRANAMGYLADLRKELKLRGLEEKVIGYGAGPLRYAEEVARSPKILKYLANTATKVNIGGIRVSGINVGSEFWVAFSEVGYPASHATKQVSLNDLHYLQAREVYERLIQDAKRPRLDVSDVPKETISQLSKLTRGQILDSFEKAISPWKLPELHK